MTPDRTLDARIFTEVFGWEAPSGLIYFKKDGDTHSMDVPRYSTNIASAWLIIDHLRGLGWDYELLNDGSRHYAVFSRKTEDAHSASADTAATAIVAAALKVVEVT